MSESFGWGRPVQRWQADYIASRMRLCDELEVMASHHMHPLEAVDHAIETSEIALCIHAPEDDEPIGLCGVSRVEHGGIIWMLGTDELTATTRRRRLLVSEGRRWVESLLADGHGPLFNWCMARNDVAIRWLRALGFHFDVPEPYGPSAQLFRHFRRAA